MGGLGVAQLEKAISAFREVLELDHDNSWALMRRGEVHYTLGRHEDALADFSRALDVQPNDTWVLAKRVQAYIALGSFKQALDDLNRVLDLDPEDDWNYFLYYLIYCLTGQSDKARQNLEIAFEKASQIYENTPGDFRIGFNIVVYRLADNKIDAANSILNRLMTEFAPYISIIDFLNDLKCVVLVRKQDFVVNQLIKDVQTRLADRVKIAARIPRM